MSKLAILGAGSWGTALAVHIARNNAQIHLWDYNPDNVNRIQKDRENKKYLQGIMLPDNVLPFVDLEAAIADVRDVLVVVPSSGFASVISQLPMGMRVAWATKGMSATGNWLHELVQTRFANMPMAVVSGPSFAMEVALKKPTAVALGGNNEDFNRHLCQLLRSDSFRVYPTADILGVEIGGVVKNILAVAAGMAAGLKLGDNALAALITRGLAEMRRLVLALGAQETTLYGLSGLGDLVLTSMSTQSRNHRFGALISQGKSVEEAKDSVGGVVEALSNVHIINEKAEEHALDMPITKEVYRVLFEGLAVPQAINALLSR